MLTLSIVLVVMAQAAPAGNAVDVDPEHHKVEFENEQVRVVRMIYSPGYKTPMHSHLPGVTVILSGAKVRSWSQNGEQSEAEPKAGEVSWSDGGQSHANQVLEGARLELIRVELKKKGNKAIPLPQHDLARIDPEHAKVEHENEQVRVVRMRFPTGYKTPLHNHLPGVTVRLTDSHTRSADEGAASREARAKAGTADWSAERPNHVTENVGNALMEAIRVELKTKP